MSEFDFQLYDEAERDARAEAYYAQKQRYRTFDTLVDMALDGMITIEEATSEYLRQTEPEPSS